MEKYKLYKISFREWLNDEDENYSYPNIIVKIIPAKNKDEALNKLMDSKLKSKEYSIYNVNELEFYGYEIIVNKLNEKSE
jgi:hypothetical protein